MKTIIITTHLLLLCLMGKAQALKPASKVNTKGSFTSVVVMHTPAKFPGGVFAMHQFLNDAGKNSAVAHTQHYSGL